MPRNQKMQASLSLLGKIRTGSVAAWLFFLIATQTSTALVHSQTARNDTRKAYNAIFSQARTLVRKGDYKAAEPLFEQMVTMRVASLGLDHINTAVAYCQLADNYVRRGNYTSAVPLYERAQIIREESYMGRDGLHTINAITNLAKVYQRLGRYSEAEPLLKRAFRRHQSDDPDGHRCAQSMEDLASFYSTIGDHLRAIEHYQQAIKIFSVTHGPNEYRTGESILGLATTYSADANHSAANTSFKKVLQIFEKEVAGDPSMVPSMNKMAQAYLSQRMYSDAKAILTKAKKHSGALASNHPELADTLFYMAHVHLHEGDLKKAESLFKQVLEMRSKVFDQNHPDTQSVLNDLTAFYLVREENNLAIQMIEQSRRAAAAHVKQILPTLPNSQQRTYLNANYIDSLHTCLAFAVRNRDTDDVVRKSVEWLVNGKAVSSEAQSQRNLIGRDIDDPDKSDIAKQLLEVREQLAKLAMTAGKSGAESRQLRISNLADKERELSNKLALSQVALSSNDTWIDFEKVQSALPKSTTLVDIVRFNPIDFDERFEKRSEPARYAAWLTFSDKSRTPQIVDLGPATAIDELAMKIRERIKESAGFSDNEESATASLKENLGSLREYIWDPIHRHCGEIDQVILSPDSSLWLVPWAALPIVDSDNSSQYLLERFNVRFVTSARDLLATPSAGKTNKPVVFANPKFDLKAEDKRAAILRVFKELPEEQYASRLNKRGSLLPRVTALPGTGIEAEAIRPKIQSYTSQTPVLYRQIYALEHAAKKLRNPKIAAFATHGFFLPERNVRDIRTASGSTDYRLDPLLRCGILLSGCNDSTSVVGDDDGILTGLEIVGIDFRGTELVVLSACDTGVGDIQIGEGVAGLRQAFQLAGAESVIASLWQVDDAETARLMKDFFNNLAKGMTKSEALRQAQLARIKARRARHGAAHPFFWAAFTLTGQD